MAADKIDWEGKHYAFFCNYECEYFPCHAGIAEADFNCLFCYCPLYALGEKCGGNFLMQDNGFKNCSGCTIPHRRENYSLICDKMEQVIALVKREKT